MNDFTVVVIPAGSRTSKGTHVSYENVIIVQNTESATKELQGREVRKVILVDLKETELYQRLRLLLMSAMMQHNQENSADIQFIEI